MHNPIGIVNGIMFVVELAVGLIAGSMALIADSLDMLADATVYGIGLSAVNKSQSSKVRAALLSGVFQMALAGLVLVDVMRRFFAGSEPESAWMVSIGFLALLAKTTAGGQSGHQEHQWKLYPPEQCQMVRSTPLEPDSLRPAGDNCPYSSKTAAMAAL